MTPVKFNITVHRGSYFEAVIETFHANGSPMDISAAQIESGIKYNYAGDTLLDFRIDQSYSNTEFTYSLLPEDTVPLKADSYHYDIFMTFENVKRKIVSGNLYLEDTATEL